jgi:adenylosuccinate synthase
VGADRFAEILKVRVKDANAHLKGLGVKPVSYKKILDEYSAAADVLRPHVTDTVRYLHNATIAEKGILFEGAQGTFLDIDHGTYPYVTSSNTTAGGACTGTGVPPHRMDKVVGVMKAYTTRVGEGPLPTEDAQISDLLHGMGREFGSTTGRARRCGWFDAVATRHAAMVNGIDELAVTNLDGLDTLDRIKVCTGYKVGAVKFDHMPADIEVLSLCEPVYEERKGWKTDTSGARKWKDLPAAARDYLRFIAGETGAKLTIASVGPGREQTIFV